MNRLMDFLLSNRWIVAALLVVLVVAGLVVMTNLPIEAFPTSPITRSSSPSNAPACPPSRSSSSSPTPSRPP